MAPIVEGDLVHSTVEERLGRREKLAAPCEVRMGGPQDASELAAAARAGA